VRVADIHDKSLSSGAGMSVRALGSACLYLCSVISLRLSLSAGFLLGAEPDIHWLHRVVGPSQKIESVFSCQSRNNSEEASGG